MRYLLDTHVFLWALTDTNKLSSPVHEVLEDRRFTIFVSSVTFWEISLKCSIGKLVLEGVSSEDLPLIALETGFQVLSLNYLETSTYHHLTSKWHRDPFDRMLIWQAIKHDLILISRDQSVGKYQNEGLKMLW